MFLYSLGPQLPSKQIQSWTAYDELVDIAAAIATGRMVFPFMDVRALKADPGDSLTEREKTLLAAFARGRANLELAAELEISVNTVKFHLRNLYEKLGFKNRSQAIAFYYAHSIEP